MLWLSHLQHVEIPYFLTLMGLFSQKYKSWFSYLHIKTPWYKFTHTNPISTEEWVWIVQKCQTLFLIYLLIAFLWTHTLNMNVSSMSRGKRTTFSKPLWFGKLLTGYLTPNLHIKISVIFNARKLFQTTTPDSQVWTLIPLFQQLSYELNFSVKIEIRIKDINRNWCFASVIAKQMFMKTFNSKNRSTETSKY